MSKSSAGFWLGIDLGTSNSSAAIRSPDGKIELVRSAAGQSKASGGYLGELERCKEFPSFIAFNRDGTIASVGMAGKERADQEPEFVVWGVKRLLGKTYSELKESGELERFPYRIRPDRTSGRCLIVVAEKSYTPVQLCAEIIKTIRAEAERQAGAKITSLVISVPAYFDPVRVTPVVDAARQAGFVLVKTIPEPVAAALALDIDITVRPIKTLVFDLGAGTLDVTAGFLCRHPDQPGEFLFQVEKNTGDTRLGGIDIDDRLARVIRERCEILGADVATRGVLRRAAELAKIRLSDEAQVRGKLSLASRECDYLLTQNDLRVALEGNGAEKNLLEACRSQVMSAITEAGWTPHEVESLILIGGPTRLPCFHEMFGIIFHSKPELLQQLDAFYSGRERVDRMTAVSLGAAMSVDRRVNDTIPSGHGFENVEIDDAAMTETRDASILLPRDSSYPARSRDVAISWTILTGVFEFKIIQHVPNSEVADFGYEYRFVGIQKFAVRNPNLCMVVLQMGYNANRELEVTIRNALSSESVAYVGIGQSVSVGMDYPLTHKRPPDLRERRVKKIPPPDAVLDRFTKWAQGAVNLVQRKVDNCQIPQTLIRQNTEGVAQILRRGNARADYEMLYTKLNGLIWNSNSKGLLEQNEYIELSEHLADYEKELFRVELAQT